MLAGRKSLSRISLTVEIDKDVDEEDVEEALLELKHLSQQCRSFGAPTELNSSRSKNESLLRSVRPSVAPPCGTSIDPKEVEDREKAEAAARAAWHQQRQKQLQSSVGLEEGTSSASSASGSFNPSGKENTEVRVKTRIGHPRSLRIPQYLLDGHAHGHTDTPVGHYMRSGTGPRRTLNRSKSTTLSGSDSQDDADDEIAGTSHRESREQQVVREPDEGGQATAHAVRRASHAHGVFGSYPDTSKGSTAVDSSMSHANAVQSTTALVTPSVASLARHTLPRLGQSALSSFDTLAKDDAKDAEVQSHARSQGV
ncbi:hypothetical protein DUNSADRAFT_17478, partial [Dunaliella salina]